MHDVQRHPAAASEARSAAPKRPAPWDLFGVLKSVAEAGAVMGALSFAAGWSYMASYYAMFGLNPMELEFSVPATCVFALHMLGNSVWPAPVLVVFLTAMAFLHNRLRLSGTWTAVFMMALLASVVAAGTWRGRAVAREDMFETSPRLPSVGFSTKTKDLEPRCLGEGTTDCKLLLHVGGVYYFFEPISIDAAPTAFSNLNVYMTPESEILAVHVQRGLR